MVVPFRAVSHPLLACRDRFHSSPRGQFSQNFRVLAVVHYRHGRSSNWKPCLPDAKAKVHMNLCVKR